ncbi:MAG: hypothetical protein A3A33_01435 [Candidatus Yanofskybacteria bacterium RIFCSPLOWO2_01_FULL_49_25]|uniref:Gfo/Idh/MocA-like oxidoreductase N-terminal domain-containing protein n=1 Tax=Candidatus Yanofskybacteria bacterium RIFCSPLOWO2_01_FULL_49_25 TaxID=1802701 RepID=A0A1F8GZB3_9BACT|nr:MAG: hypothetical protein A3A33_01435 [Candidatus Yanofskybacteria bacterium RIFCSPLOWO2_01_FULL_49_25]
MPLRFGLIGDGRFGKHYKRLLAEIPGVELAAVVTEETSITVEDMLRDASIDAVVIATPPSTHATLMSQALTAGKHVHVEKPMVLSVAEAEKIQPLVLKSGRICMVGYQYLYNDYIRELKKRMPALGPIRYVMAEHRANGPIRSDVGIFMDAAPHDLAILEYLFQTGEVASAVGKRLMITNAERDDFTAVTARFENGLTAHLVTTWLAPEKIRRIAIVGQNGSAIYDDVLTENKLRIFNEQGDTAPLQITAGEPLRNELEHFIDCIINTKQPLTDFEFGLKVTRRCEEILRSI